MDWVHVVTAALGGLSGVLASIYKLDATLKAKMAEHFASKQDTARLEAKIDTVLQVVMLSQNNRKRRSRKG